MEIGNVGNVGRRKRKEEEEKKWGETFYDEKLGGCQAGLTIY